MKKNCEVCGVEFDGKHHSKYCNIFCQNRRNREPKGGNIDKTCLNCGEDFKANREWSKWCSELCGSRGRKKGLGDKISYKYKDRKYVLGESDCLNCGTTFIKKNHTHKFCKAKCKSDLRCELERIENKKKLPTITCNECGITCKPVRLDGTTCGKRECVDESRRKTKVANDIKACKKGGHRYEQYRKTQNRVQKVWKKNKYITDPKYNITVRMRGSLRHALKGMKKNAPTFTLLGYTPTELVLHLESQFTDGMSWERIDEIHIDHIRPVASFNYTTTDCEDFKKCWALENLQPMWAKDNLSKGSKWEGKRWRVKT